jgi:hypothetical protein
MPHVVEAASRRSRPQALPDNGAIAIGALLEAAVKICMET